MRAAFLLPFFSGLLAAAGCALAGPHVASTRLHVSLDPATSETRVTARLGVQGGGEIELLLSDEAKIDRVEVDGRRFTDFTFAPEDEDENGDEDENENDEAEQTEEDKESEEARGPSVHVFRASLPAGTHELAITYHADFADDPAAGERPGMIHNMAVNAHVSETGIFLSDSSCWHPVWMDPADEHPALMPMSVEIEPLPEGWVLVASGDPVGTYADPSEPCWEWATPRPVEGVVIAGNKHQVASRVHETPFGPVEIVMQVGADHVGMMEMYLNEAVRYLDIYVPLLGPFPYKRFSIVENFFSSGFAFPGLTVLSSQVIAMGPRSLMPGFLDHEMVHNWWGNGVYVDYRHGNWCEGLTSYCANYYRRVADDGEEAGRAYRLGTLMKLAADPDGLDNGPLDQFSMPGGPTRFVGYDKGAFVFQMLESHRTSDGRLVGRERLFAALRLFAKENMGRRAGWAEIQDAVEGSFGRPMDTFFDHWVHQHVVPVTTRATDFETIITRFTDMLAEGQRPTLRRGTEDGREWIEIDPDFEIYRVVPPEQITPTVAGTTGQGGLRIVTDGLDEQAEVQAFLEWNESTDDGENLLLIGRNAAETCADLIDRSGDPITWTADGFTVGGQTYDQPSQGAVHTMVNADRPGRFITVFLTNGDTVWSRLRVIHFYTRDSTVVWDGRQVAYRNLFEPDRRVWLSK